MNYENTSSETLCQMRSDYQQRIATLKVWLSEPGEYDERQQDKDEVNILTGKIKAINKELEGRL